MIEQPSDPNPNPREKPDVVNQPPTEEKPLPRPDVIPEPHGPDVNPGPPPTVPKPIVD